MSIQVRNLTHIYNQGMPDEDRALSNINFDIYDGEVASIIGHTGSGKSTLVQHLNGLLKPTEGSIIVGGTDITKPGVSMLDVRRRVGLVFQYPEYQLFEETVAKDVAFGPKNLGLSEKEIERRVEQALRMVGLDYGDVKDRSPFDLSGGQRRRVAIAGVIAMEPKVLILDEPTAGLDPAGSASILANIDAYRQANNATVIIVSHSMEDVARITDRLVVVSHGTLPFVGAPREVFSHGEELNELGLSVPAVNRVFARIRAAGIDLDPAVYTVDQAKAALLKALARKGGR